MKFTADTNVLVRALVQDDAKQAKIAARVLKNADQISASLAVLCEFVWVLRTVYGFSKTEVASAITVLAATGNVNMNRPAVDLGLAVLLAGGDFADGVIAFEGKWLGGDMFVSLDKDAVGILGKQGQAVKLL
jgi:predicted nucleic-acid-binding protein